MTQAKLTIGAYVALCTYLLIGSRLWEEGPWARRQIRKLWSGVKWIGRLFQRYLVDEPQQRPGNENIIHVERWSKH